MTNADVLLNLVVRFMIQPPADLAPRTRPVALCVYDGYKHRIPTASGVTTLNERLRHQLTCPSNANKWRITHNALEDLIEVLLVQAGMQHVMKDPKYWDWEAHG